MFLLSRPLQDQFDPAQSGYGSFWKMITTSTVIGAHQMKKVLILLALGTLAATASRADAQGFGDPRDGLGRARTICAECHAIERAQARSPNARSPTFTELANTPGMTAAALTVALTTPHAGMPMFILTPEQRANIIAYILSLKE